MREFFSDIHCWDLVDLLQVKITEVWGPQMTESPAGVFISQACPHWASSSSSITVQDAFTRHRFPQRFLLWDVVFFWIHLSLHQFWVQPFALWPHFYWSSKKSCWVFSLLSFFFYLFLGWIGGFPGGTRGKEPTGQCRGHKRQAWQHIPVFLFIIPWASLIAQLVKNPPAMQDTLVQFLGQEDPLEKG